MGNLRLDLVQTEDAKKMMFGMLKDVLPGYKDSFHSPALHILLIQIMSDPEIGQSVIDFLQRIYPTLR